MTPSPWRALVVEDDPSWQQILAELLTDCGLEVDVAGNLEQALVFLKAQPHRLAVIDLSLDEYDHNNHDGLQVLTAVRRLDPACQTIMLTGFATVELAVSVLTEYGALTFLRKENFSRAQFRDIVARALSSAPAARPAEVKPATPTPSPPVSPRTLVGKALVVDDDAGWRSLLTEMLTDLGFSVRACSGYGEALGYLRREKFLVAVVDLSLSGEAWKIARLGGEMEGYQLLDLARTLNVPAILVSGAASKDAIQRAYMEHGVFACLEKQTFDRASFSRLVQEATQTRRPSGELALLTEREREVLELLAQGLTNKVIAERLQVSTNTVKRHLKAIFEKWGVHTRAAAVAKAVEALKQSHGA